MLVMLSMEGVRPKSAREGEDGRDLLPCLDRLLGFPIILESARRCGAAEERGARYSAHSGGMDEQAIE